MAKYTRRKDPNATSISCQLLKLHAGMHSLKVEGGGFSFCRSRHRFVLRARPRSPLIAGKSCRPRKLPPCGSALSPASSGSVWASVPELAEFEPSMYS